MSSTETVVQHWKPSGVACRDGLSVTCNDGTNGIVDMSALVNSSNAGIFATLKDAQLFQQVNVELSAITWPNGADLDPVWVHEEISKNKTWSVPV